MQAGDWSGPRGGTREAAGATRDIAALYDTYADALFGFCVDLVHDRAVAERALCATLIAGAARADRLREPGRTRALLYASARVECARALGGSARGPGVVEQVLAAGAATWAVPDRHRLLPLVPYALWAVDEDERLALLSAERHGLGHAEIADVLAVPERRVPRLLARAREQFGQSLAVYAVATHGRRDCPELALLLPDGGLAIEPGLRTPLFLHVDSCPDCLALGPGPLDLTALLAGGVSPAAPHRARAALLAGGHAGGAVSIGRAGFPPGLGRPRSRVPLAVGCLVAVSLVSGLTVIGTSGRPDTGAPVALSTAEPAGDHRVTVYPPHSASPSLVPRSTTSPRATPKSTRPTGTTPTAKPSRAPRTSPSTKPSTRDAAKPSGSARSTPSATATPRAPGIKPRSGAAPQAGPGTATPSGAVTWSRSTLDLGAGAGAQTVRLTASGGPVTWSVGVSANDWLTVSPKSGSLTAGKSVAITISADPNKAPAPTWEVVLTARPGDRAIVVRGGGRTVAVR